MEPITRIEQERERPARGEYFYGGTDPVVKRLDRKGTRTVYLPAAGVPLWYKAQHRGATLTVRQRAALEWERFDIEGDLDALDDQPSGRVLRAEPNAKGVIVRRFVDAD